MAKLTVAGILGLDGEYDLVLPPFTMNEWHEIKVKTGLRPLELEEAFAAGDVDTMGALAWVTLTRGGHNPKQVWAALGEQDIFTALTFDFTEDEQAEDDAVPPAPPTPTVGSDADETGTDDAATSSGETSSGNSESQESTLVVTGEPI